jgi:hypothetical protein
MKLFETLYSDLKFDTPQKKSSVLHFFIRRLIYIFMGIILTDRDAGIR